MTSPWKRLDYIKKNLPKDTTFGQAVKLGLLSMKDLEIINDPRLYPKAKAEKSSYSFGTAIIGYLIGLGLHL